MNDPHGLYESGTASGGGRSQIIDTTKNWITNQWAGFTAKFTGDNQVALIQSNTSNTLNVFYYTDSGGGHVWQAGNGYQIHRISVALDQPGRGQGDLIVGNPPINRRTGTAAWPNQALEPTYSWNNIYTPNNTPVNITVGTGGFMLVEGRDYFNNTPMPGYRPYVYPHPLVTAQPTPPPPPPPSTMCSQLQQRLSRLQSRQQRLQQRHRQNQRLNRRIRRLRQQLQAQDCV